MNDLIIFVGHCDIFYGPVILLCFSDQDIILKILLQSATINDLIHFLGYCDLNCMVPLICLVTL